MALPSLLTMDLPGFAWPDGFMRCAGVATITLASLGLVMTLGFLLLVSLVVSTALSAISPWLDGIFPGAQNSHPSYQFPCIFGPMFPLSSRRCDFRRSTRRTRRARCCRSLLGRSST